MEETISRMAGSAHGSSRTAEELADLARSVGRVPRQRTTTYGRVDDVRTPTPTDITDPLDATATTRV